MARTDPDFYGKRQLRGVLRQAGKETEVKGPASPGYGGPQQVTLTGSTLAAGLKVRPVSPLLADLFPEPAALANSMANPTTSGVAAYLMGHNPGTVWDRIRTTSTGDAVTTGILAAGGYGFNGVSMDRLRMASVTANQSTGVLAVAAHISDNSANFIRPLAIGALGDGAAGGNIPSNGPFAFNGSTHDRVRNNQNLTLLSSAARTATTNSSDQTNHNARGAHVVIDVSAVAATPSVTFTVEGRDALSGAYYTILQSVPVTGVGTTVLRVYPGLTAAANTVANDVLPRTWRVTATHGDADSITYSVGASLIL